MLDPDWIPVGLFAVVMGASVGSFVNVVAYRLPAGLSLVHPPSRCPHCRHRLGVTENVPVLGWLWLRGRCRHCRAPISLRYPLVEAVMALVFLGILVRCGVTLETGGYWVLAAWLMALALIDWDTLSLPHRLTKSGLVAGLGFQMLTAGPAGLLRGLLGMTLGLWLVDAIALLGSWMLGKTAMGAGDSKLAAMMGAWLGGPLFLLAGFLAGGLGAIAGGVALAVRGRSQPIPFGPFLAIGTLLAALFGADWWAAYWQWALPLR